jgi:hypothetical protein
VRREYGISLIQRKRKGVDTVVINGIEETSQRSKSIAIGGKSQVVAPARVGTVFRGVITRKGLRETFVSCGRFRTQKGGNVSNNPSDIDFG